MVIVDFNGIAIGSIMGQLNRGEPLTSGLVKHIVLNNLRMYRVKYPESEYGNMVIACDSRSWRKDVYPQYKAARTTTRATDKYDWDALYGFIDEVLDDLRENFPYAVIKIEKAEADDIIGALAIHKSEPILGEHIVIISADKDFIQLQQGGNVIQFSPMFQKMIKEDNPEKYIFEHIMKGDSSDGVPNVMSPDNSFTDKIRQTPMKKKLIQEWWEKRDDLKSVMPSEAYRNYMRNREMIDLRRTPEHIKEESITQYESYKYKSRNNILTYLVENKMKLLVECAGEF
jgi:5'-3' exonuclease